MKDKMVIIYVFAVINLFSTCTKTMDVPSEPCVIQNDSLAIASKLLTLSRAEKIMGESGNLSCNTFIKKGDTLEYKCEYTALLKDKITGKTGKLGFMHEVYASDAGAENAYEAIYQANRQNAGVQIVAGLGDEAYYHSDGKNFYFYLVRKKQKMFRIKLNKTTSHSSELEFKNVAKLILDMI